MKFYLLLFSLILSVSSAQAATCPAAGDNCPGKTCARLGTTQLADDQISIVACLRSAADPATLVWKSMIDTSPSKLDIVKITTTLCKWGGVYDIIATCPDGYELLGCGGGEGDLLENAESWFLDPDFANRRCVGHIRQPACNGTSDQSSVIASCYKL